MDFVVLVLDGGCVSLPSGLPGGGVTCSYRLIEAVWGNFRTNGPDGDTDRFEYEYEYEYEHEYEHEHEKNYEQSIGPKYSIESFFAWRLLLAIVRCTRSMHSFARANRLLDFLNGVSGSVFASDQRIALLGIIAYEAAGFRIEFHPVAHPDGLVLGIDLMGV